MTLSHVAFASLALINWISGKTFVFGAVLNNFLCLRNTSPMSEVLYRTRFRFITKFRDGKLLRSKAPNVVHFACGSREGVNLRTFRYGQFDGEMPETTDPGNAHLVALFNQRL